MYECRERDVLLMYLCSLACLTHVCTLELFTLRMAKSCHFIPYPIPPSYNPSFLLPSMDFHSRSCFKPQRHDLIQGILGFYECIHVISTFSCSAVKLTALLSRSSLLALFLLGLFHFMGARTSIALTCCTWPPHYVLVIYIHTITLCIRNSFKILTRMLGMCSMHTENTLGSYLFLHSV